MSKLITGKEALIALANGEKVLIRNHHWDNFDDLTQYFSLNVFFMDEYEFKLKPRTVTLNGIEVPKPQKGTPKNGNDVFTLDFTRNEGYTSWRCQNSMNTFDSTWWQTEDEIKQVVAALRQVLGAAE